MRFCRLLPDTKPQENAEATYGLLEGDTVRKIDRMPWRKWTAGNRRWPAKEAGCWRVAQSGTSSARITSQNHAPFGKIRGRGEQAGLAYPRVRCCKACLPVRLQSRILHVQGVER